MQNDQQQHKKTYPEGVKCPQPNSNAFILARLRLSSSFVSVMGDL